MSTYSLIAAAEATVHRLTHTGGSSLVSLARDAELITFGLCVEQLGDSLEAVITFAGTTSSITLPTAAESNARDLCDYIEALANGTAETAAEAPSPSLRCCGDCEELSADLSALPGIHAVQIAGQAVDMVNKPAHYTGHPSGIECIEVAEHLPFCLGNAFKYLFRRAAKGNELENVEKALWYVRRHIERWALDMEPGSLDKETIENVGVIASHEPFPISAAMLIIATPPQCGGYDACIGLLQQEVERLRSIEAFHLANAA